MPSTCAPSCPTVNDLAVRLNANGVRGFCQSLNFVFSPPVSCSDETFVNSNRVDNGATPVLDTAITNLVADVWSNADPVTITVDQENAGVGDDEVYMIIVRGTINDDIQSENLDFSMTVNDQPYRGKILM